jgi:uncharacterized protein (TIGR02646 family)
MIHVDCWCPLNNQAWKAWAKKAEEVRLTLIEEFSPKKRSVTATKPTITNLYKDAVNKELLLNFFHFKCAYCECPLTRKSCDVEHFRPKGRVTEADNSPVTRLVGRKQEIHLGYYWLAYEWGNLLPSCGDCNRPGDGYGKWDRFPVRDFRAFVPGEEMQEEPMLLNPWWQNPDAHFVFEANGSIGGVTDEGKACVEMFRLYRDTLISEREKVYTLVRGHFQTLFNAIMFSNQDEAARQRKHIYGYLQGVKPFSAMGRFAINQTQKEIEQGLGGTISWGW